MTKSENVLSADNQQERSRIELCLKISGFVDGEGSFHVGIQKSKNVKLGWQIVPEFHVSQSQDRQDALEIIKKIFGAGYIKPNHQNNPRDKTSVFVVRDRKSLTEKVIPFFHKYPLFTGKRYDLEKFSKVVEMMNNNDHLTNTGLRKILKIAFSMNRNGIYRKYKIKDIILSSKSSETIRRTR
jgi:hypothetical protein